MAKQTPHYQRTAAIWRVGQSSTELLLLLALNEFTDANGRCFPSQATLAKMTRQSERTVRDYITRLTERGLIARERQPKRGGGWHYRYKVRWSAFPEPETGPENLSGSVERTGNCFPSGPEIVSPPDRKQFPPNLSMEPIHGTTSCSESGQAGSKPSATADPVVLTFPTVGTGAKEWGLHQSKLAEYVGSYPGIDVLAECRKALQWLRDNPKKRKTATGMPRFLGSWLGRCQDRGSCSNDRPVNDPYAGLAEETARRRRDYQQRAKAMGGEK